MRAPWGKMYKLISLPFMWLKILLVKERTSLHKHDNRDEYFIGFFRAKRGEFHRHNRGFYIELAIGKPKEKDVERKEDDYNR